MAAFRISSLNLLIHIDVQIQRDIGAAIKGADRLGGALLSLVFGVYLVIDIRRKRMEAVATIVLSDKAFHCQGLGVLQIDDCRGQRLICWSQDLPSEVTRLLLIGTCKI